MVIHFIRALVASSIILLSVQLTSAQVRTGAPPFGSFGGGPDVVDLANLNVHLDVPIINKAGRGGTNFTYDLSYDSSIWYPVVSGSTYKWQFVPNWGWNAATQGAVGYIGYTSVNTSACNGNGQTTTYTWTYYDKAGTPHPWSYTSTYTHGNASCQGGTTGFTQEPPSDGSGFLLSVNGSSVLKFTTKAGAVIQAPLQTGIGSGNYTDRNGNEITVNSSGQFFDTINGTTPVLTVVGSGTPSSPLTFTYTSPSGASVAYTVKYSAFTVQTNFTCSGITNYPATSVNLVSEIDLPDHAAQATEKYTFTYEPTPGATGHVTGRIASVTLPTGGQITYSYSGANNGISCTDGSALGLTRVVTTDNGTWTYTRSQGTGSMSNIWTTTVTDPQSNQTQVNFSGIYEVSQYAYQGSTSGTLLQNHVICYNGNFTNCTGSTIVPPISSRWDYRYIPNLTNPAISGTFYDVYGNLTEDKEYDYVPSSNGFLTDTQIVYIAPGGNAITNLPQTITVSDNGGNVLSKVTNTYDDPGTLTATSGTPQHTSITGTDRGNLTSTTSLVKTGASLTKHFTYYDTGELNTATDVNGAASTYIYGAASCGNTFPTQVNEPLSLIRKFAWNCTGGVQTSITDENNQTASTAYTDAYFWRPSSTTDATSAVTNFTYPSPTTSESVLNIASGSAVDVYTTLDGLGRVHLQQKRQAPGSTNFDTVETDYDKLGRISRVTQPYVGTAGQTNSSAPATTTTYDALSRPTQVTDPGNGTTNGTVGYTYSQNDVLITAGPAPTGENTKKRQLQYDGLGRITSVCEITSATPSGACNQSVSASGYLTTYTYGPGNVFTVKQNAQTGGTQQTRTYNYDDVGRLISETNPESGTTSYAYDVIPPGCYAAGTAEAGDLTQRQNAASDNNCFIYDSLHRVTSVGSRTGCKRFAYDNGTVTGSRPTGVTTANSLGRMTEALTDDCSAWPPTPITDEWFSYSARGEVLNVWQSTKHSGGYYPLVTNYFANGATNGLIGAGGYAAYWYLDGEGRVTYTFGGYPLSSTVYNAASQPTQLNFNTGDSDSFAYDNAGRMKQYNYTVNGQTLTGNTTWNANGTLASLFITDPFNAANTQNCAYTHDDLVRIASVNCGASVWQQNFSYDPFGNIVKTVPGGGTGYGFAATYQASTNHILSVGTTNATYDQVGDITYDTIRNYTWDAFGNATTISNSGGSTSIIYDAFDRMVEQSNSGSYKQFIYSPTGFKMQIMNGQTSLTSFVPLPGGASLVYIASGYYIRHADWLGSSRFASTSARAMYSDVAYAPFGEPYAQSGTDLNFTGMNSDTSAGLYDFLYREYSTQGRWSQPDPAGLSAVDFADPQSWNRYAYGLNNPCSNSDPLGLATCMFTIRINNKAGLSASQLQTIEGRINQVFGSAQTPSGNSVQGQFVDSGNSDFGLTISSKTDPNADGRSGWPFGSPVIYWGSIMSSYGGFGAPLIYAGTTAAHEIVHRGAGPVHDEGKAYIPPPNLMNVDQASLAGFNQQINSDWSNSASASGFASLSPAQVQKLYSKCTKAHPPSRGISGRPIGTPQGLFWNSIWNFWMDTLPQTTSVTVTVGGQPVGPLPF